MNRTLLIFLMIGTALMIAVIGGKRSTSQMEYMPWQIDTLKNGHTRVFGITLEKTSIQDANQILSSFPDTRLYDADSTSPRLVAVYDELNISGLLAQIELVYDVDAAQLMELQQLASPVENQDYKKLPADREMALLDAVVKELIYKPAIDYQADDIQQRFGPPTEDVKLDENTRLWRYPDLGLQIRVSDVTTDEFIYSSLATIPPETPAQ